MTVPGFGIDLKTSSPRAVELGYNHSAPYHAWSHTSRIIRRHDVKHIPRAGLRPRSGRPSRAHSAMSTRHRPHIPVHQMERKGDVEDVNYLSARSSCLSIPSGNAGYWSLAQQMVHPPDAQGVPTIKNMGRFNIPAQNYKNTQTAAAAGAAHAANALSPEPNQLEKDPLQRVSAPRSWKGYQNHRTIHRPPVAPTEIEHRQNKKNKQQLLTQHKAARRKVLQAEYSHLVGGEFTEKWVKVQTMKKVPRTKPQASAARPARPSTARARVQSAQSTPQRPASAGPMGSARPAFAAAARHRSPSARLPARPTSSRPAGPRPASSHIATRKAARSAPPATRAASARGQGKLFIGRPPPLKMATVLPLDTGAFAPAFLAQANGTPAIEELSRLAHTGLSLNELKKLHLIEGSAEADTADDASGVAPAAPPVPSVVAARFKLSNYKLFSNDPLTTQRLQKEAYYHRNAARTPTSKHTTDAHADFTHVPNNKSPVAVPVHPPSFEADEADEEASATIGPTVQQAASHALSAEDAPEGGGHAQEANQGEQAALPVSVTHQPPAEGFEGHEIAPSVVAMTLKPSYFNARPENNDILKSMVYRPDAIAMARGVWTPSSLISHQNFSR